MNWILCVVLAVVCLSAHYLSLKVLGGSFPALVVAPIMYVFGLLTLSIIYISSNTTFNWSDLISVKTIFFLAVAGITIGLTDFFVVKAINLGGEISSISPMLVGSTAALVAVSGYLIFSESLSVLKISGIVLAIIGTVLIHKG